MLHGLNGHQTVRIRRTHQSPSRDEGRQTPGARGSIIILTSQGRFSTGQKNRFTWPELSDLLCRIEQHLVRQPGKRHRCKRPDHTVAPGKQDPEPFSLGLCNRAGYDL